MAKKKIGKTDKDSGLIPRPPIVVVMGHIDHGKTTLLDFIRKTKVTEKESGGITQHIGAYEIEFKGNKITFIDTPGHEAFSKMRSRGAKVADVAILVVAADEGVKEQTKEAIQHIKEATIPFIVAINKIDKPGANPEKLKKELAENEVLVESWGGKIPSAEISAKSGQKIDELLDLILLTAELEELKADPKEPASGIVIESNLDSKRGPIATLIIKNGALKLGDYIAAGRAWGRVKILENDWGKSLKSACFSTPVVCVGFEKTPGVGEEFFSHHQKKILEDAMAEKIKLTLIETAAKKPEEGKFLKIILKADTLGTLEALADSLGILTYEEVSIQVIKKEVGEINESNVKMAEAVGGIVVGFRVKTSPAIQNFARERKIDIINSEIIYDLIEKI
ncbi:MAG: translation initiation factor IF-2, partial [bacterium]|nr:translation initiation factor IF-2 [bacterium]